MHLGMLFDWRRGKFDDGLDFWQAGRTVTTDEKQGESAWAADICMYVQASCSSAQPFPNPHWPYGCSGGAYDSFCVNLTAGMANLSGTDERGRAGRNEHCWEWSPLPLARREFWIIGAPYFGPNTKLLYCQGRGRSR